MYGKHGIQSNAYTDTFRLELMNRPGSGGFGMSFDIGCDIYTRFVSKVSRASTGSLPGALLGEAGVLFQFS